VPDPAQPFPPLATTRLAGCSPDQLDYWARHSVVVPAADGSYGFRDLVALRMIKSLLDAGVPLRRVRRAVSALAEYDDLAGLRLVADGERVYACHDEGAILDALGHGQLALFVAVHRIVNDVEADVAAFDRDRQSFVAGLRDDDIPPSDALDAPSDALDAPTGAG
jgi:DNA-binding transcriptional MerR regulator